MKANDAAEIGTASVEKVEEPVVEEKIVVEEPVVVDGFVLDRTQPIEVPLPKWATQASFGYALHKDLRDLGWKLVGGSSDSKERGLVYIAPYDRWDGTPGVTLRVSFRR